VVVGDASYEKEYIAHLKRIAGPGTIFTGYVFGHAYRELSSNAFLVVEPSEVGGTHPAIVEAMGLGNCVVVNGIAENRETVGNAGVWYDGTQGSKDLQTVIERLLNTPEEVQRLRHLAMRHVSMKFQWDRIVDEYEALFERVLARGRAAWRASDTERPPIPARGAIALPPARAAAAAQTIDRRG
jgi:glycosyltransferase involved in cell wall biosynthesis